MSEKYIGEMNFSALSSVQRQFFQATWLSDILKKHGTDTWRPKHTSGWLGDWCPCRIADLRMMCVRKFIQSTRLSWPHEKEESLSVFICVNPRWQILHPNTKRLTTSSSWKLNKLGKCSTIRSYRFSFLLWLVRFHRHYLLAQEKKKYLEKSLENCSGPYTSEESWSGSHFQKL